MKTYLITFLAIFYFFHAECQDVKVKKGSIDTYYTTAGGTVEVNKNKVLVLADSIEKVEEIDEERAEQAKKRAEERFKRKNEEEIDEARAQAALSRAINRLNAVKKYSS